MPIDQTPEMTSVNWRPRHIPQRPAGLPTSAIAAIALAAVSSSPRAEVSPWYLGLSETITHESNVYRVPDSAQLQAPYFKSDTLSGTALLGGLDQQWGRQHLGATISVSNNRYQHNSSRNNTSYSLGANLEWETVERVSGRLSVASDQSLARLIDTSNSQVITLRNEVRNNQLDAVARIGAVTRLTLEAGAGYRDTNYSAAQYDRYDNRQTYGSLGVRWQASPALQVGSALRMTHGNYPHFPATGAATGSGIYDPDSFRRTDLDLNALWTPSGATNVSVRFSPTQTRYDRNTVRNLSGVTGLIRGDWQPRGRLKLSAYLSRDNGQSSDVFNLSVAGGNLPGVNDYGRVTTALQLNATYDVSAKTSVTANLGQSRRNLVNTTFVSGTQLAQNTGSDNTNTLSFGARWAPFRSVQTGCDLSREQRHAQNALSWSYRYTSWSCFGQMTLQ